MLEDFKETPALGFAERACFHDTDAIAYLGFVFLVMGMKFRGVFCDFAEFRVGDAGDSADDDGFIHFVRDNFTHANLAESAGFGGGGVIFFHLLGGCFCGLAAENGFDASDVAARGANKVRALELTALLLDAQVEEFLAEFALAGQ